MQTQSALFVQVLRVFPIVKLARTTTPALDVHQQIMHWMHQQSVRFVQVL
jgi:hypothetical protein